jgi:DNA invertase Pin-like site-specific DNA recombinase
MESGVEFVAVDMPQANRLTIHILAAVAEHEREMISQHTKAALQAAKKRGVTLGSPQPKKGDARHSDREPVAIVPDDCKESVEKNRSLTITFA